MRILLLSANTAVSPYPVFPLGLTMIAAALREEGHEVRIFDPLVHGSGREPLTRVLRAWEPELLGVSLRNIDNVNLVHEQRYLDTARALVEICRQESRAPIVLGGSGFSLMPERLLEALRADYGIVGEGERAMGALARALAEGQPPATRCLRAPPSLEGLSIPSPAYDPELLAFYVHRGAIAPVQTKRGCAYRCAYCSYPLLEGAAVRLRDPGKVVADIRLLTERHGVRYIFFVDSVFNDREGQYRLLIEEMERENICVPWTAFFSPGGHWDDAVLRRMRHTGLTTAEIGTDAASDATLAGLEKRFSFEDVMVFNQHLVRHGITPAHFLMFGGPDETRETVTEGLRNLERLEGAIVFAFLGVRILPGTALAARAQQEGILAPGTDLLPPTYYLSPAVERDWLENTLTRTFAQHRNWVFPPDALDDVIRVLHRIGYAGSLMDLLAARAARPQPPTRCSLP